MSHTVLYQLILVLIELMRASRHCLCLPIVLCFVIVCVSAIVLCLAIVSCIAIVLCLAIILCIVFILWRANILRHSIAMLFKHIRSTIHS